MADGFAVDALQIRAHGARIEDLQQRFGAVKAASAAIAADNQAYGLLCGWMAAILERRHARHDQLIAYVEENLRLAAESLIRTSQDYEEVDNAAAERVRRAAGL